MGYPGLRSIGSGLTAVALKVGIFVSILESKSRAMSNMLDGVTEEV
jgi:hypothetical protein